MLLRKLLQLQKFYHSRLQALRQVFKKDFPGEGLSRPTPGRKVAEGYSSKVTTTVIPHRKRGSKFSRSRRTV